MALPDDPQAHDAAQVHKRGLTRTLLLIAGTLCVALGVLGMFLPVLPTTPLLLLAAACYARSSERFYRWLMTNRWCGRYISNYRAGHGIPLKHKVLAISLMWLTIGYAACFVVTLWWLRIVLVAMAIGVTIHLVRMKTFKPQAHNLGHIERLAAAQAAAPAHPDDTHAEASDVA